MFSQESVILSTGGVCLWVKGGVCLPLDPGGVVSASGPRGVYPSCTHNPFSHTPPGQTSPPILLGRHPPRQTPPPPGRHTPLWADTPGQIPPRRPLQWTVRILLECILVNSNIVSLHSIRSSTKKMIDY